MGSSVLAAAALLAAATRVGGDVSVGLEPPAARPAEPEPPSYDLPPFANWDCVGVSGVLDWDRLYDVVVSSLRDPAARDQRFILPVDIVEVLQRRGSELYGECPLGTLYFLVLYTYEFASENPGAEAVRQADHLVRAMRRYPFFLVAGARWPTFEAFDHFADIHEPQNEKAVSTSLCEGVRGASGIEWDAVLEAALQWGDQQLHGLEPGEGNGEYARVLKAAAEAMYQNPRGAGAAAQEECPWGFIFLCTTQVIAAAVRLTGSFEVWARALDKMLAEVPFYSVSGSRWPTFQVLAMFSSLSKGDNAPTLGSFQADIHRWGGAHPQTKRFRQYGDLRLLPHELSPFGRTAEGWAYVDALVGVSAAEWYNNFALQRLEGLRPIMGAALDAALAVVRALTFPSRLECGFSGITAEQCRARGCSWREPAGEAAVLPWCVRPRPARKVVGVTFVWGEKWAPLVPRFAAWATKLGLHTIVVAMGDACRQACQAAVNALGGPDSSGIACWDPLHFAAGGLGQNPERGSILQRHAIVHVLLHLGVDVVAFDFDTFFFADPRVRLEALADEGGADILMTRHLDADCLNMGLLYIRASSRTAEWYSRYLEWLHLHLYEREQRGMNALLGFTSQAVSFPPKGLPRVKAAALDDHNEFASSRGGWLGDWGRLRFFHWVNPTVTQTDWAEIKVSDLRALYSVALHHSTDVLAGGGSLAATLRAAGAGTLQRPVRDVMQSMQVAVLPERRACW